MSKTKRYSSEIKARAVRLVQEACKDYPWLCSAAESLERVAFEWVVWLNHQRLLEPLGYSPPAEVEQHYYSQSAAQAEHPCT